MNVVVCIKSVLTSPAQNPSERPEDATELNPYDRPAIEFALSVAEEEGGTVTALSMGPPSARFALLETLAMGAHRAVLISEKALAGSDTLVTSSVLAKAIKKIGDWDLLVFGLRSFDGDTGQVGPQAAAIIDVPLITGVTRIAKEEKGRLVQRRADGFVDEFLVSLPAAFTIHPSANKPRYVGLGGLETAYTEGEIEEWTATGELGMEVKELGWAGSPTLVRGTRQVSRERKCEFVEGSVQEQAEKLLKLLSNKGLIG